MKREEFEHWIFQRGKSQISHFMFSVTIVHHSCKIGKTQQGWYMVEDLEFVLLFPNSGDSQSNVHACHREPTPIRCTRMPQTARTSNVHAKSESRAVWVTIVKTKSVSRKKQTGLLYQPSSSNHNQYEDNSHRSTHCYLDRLWRCQTNSGTTI